MRTGTFFQMARGRAMVRTRSMNRARAIKRAIAFSHGHCVKSAY